MRNPTVCFIFIALVAGLALAWTPAAHALTYGFSGITNDPLSSNDDHNVSIGESQLFMSIEAVGSNQVRFIFHNKGPHASVVEEIYFDTPDQALLEDLASAEFEYIAVSDALSFAVNDRNPNLPGGNTIGFDESFSAYAKAPAPRNGIDPGEQLGILFDLVGTATYQDVINALESGNLRVGLHVIAYADGGSESFVNNTTPVPLPATIWLLGAGLTTMIASRMRRGRR